MESNETIHWKSKTHPMSGTIFEISKQIDKINDKTNECFVTATMMQLVHDAEGKPLKSSTEPWTQIYDAIIFYKVNPRSPIQVKLPDIQAVKMPVIEEVVK